MGLFGGTQPIVTNDLVFCLDVGSYKCITGSTDDISNGVVTYLNQYLCEGANGNPGGGTHTPNPAYMPTYSSDYGGILDFSGGRGMNVVQNLGATTVSTYSIWVLWDSGDYLNQYFLMQDPMVVFGFFRITRDIISIGMRI